MSGGRVRRRASALLAAGLGWVFVSAFAYASGAAERSLEETLADAVASYTEALDTEARDARLAAFRRAQALFAGLAEQRAASADLYVNWGNAALQAEDLGTAVLAYRRALSVDADHARALQNLEHARSLLPSWVPRPEPAGVFDSLFLWHRTVAEPVRERIAAGCFAGAALLLAASLRFRQVALRNAAVLPAILWLALVTSLVVDPVGDARDAAVVTAPDSVARAADSALAPSAFPQPLPAGVEVRILEQRTPWLRVRLANGRDAWLHRSDVVRVVPDDTGDA